MIYPGACIHVCVHFKLFITEMSIHLYSSRADNMVDLRYPSPGCQQYFVRGYYHCREDDSLDGYYHLLCILFLAKSDLKIIELERYFNSIIFP